VTSPLVRPANIRGTSGSRTKVEKEREREALAYISRHTSTALIVALCAFSAVVLSAHVFH
jgi:hypothetical protein